MNLSQGRQTPFQERGEGLLGGQEILDVYYKRAVLSSPFTDKAKLQRGYIYHPRTHRPWGARMLTQAVCCQSSCSGLFFGTTRRSLLGLPSQNTAGSGADQQKSVVSQLWRRRDQGWFLVRALFLPCEQCLLCAHVVGSSPPPPVSLSLFLFSPVLPD